MLITLTTDFGMQDAYVSIMKGVMARIAPNAPLVDITHTIPPQDVRAAAYLLWTALPYFPEESVHLVVVDPGVGTERRAIAARTAWGALVGPDNGVFSYVWASTPASQIVALENPAYQRPQVSHTFHGRDVFAPAAAHLARGAPLADLGPAVSDPVRLPAPRLTVSGARLEGEVLHIDHFGNVITSVGRLVWDSGLLRLDPAFGAATSRPAAQTLHPRRVRIEAGGHTFDEIRRTYGEVEPGAPLALVGSEGMLELSVAHAALRSGLGQAHGAGATALDLAVGDLVHVIVQ